MGETVTGDEDKRDTFQIQDTCFLGNKYSDINFQVL